MNYSFILTFFSFTNNNSFSFFVDFLDAPLRAQQNVSLPSGQARRGQGRGLPQSILLNAQQQQANRGRPRGNGRGVVRHGRAAKPQQQFHFDDIANEDDLSRFSDSDEAVFTDHSSDEEPDMSPQDETLESEDEDDPLFFYLCPEASQRGKDVLADSYGYAYTVKKLNKDGSTCYWRCCKRDCHASVIQTGGNYVLGMNDHNHESPGRSPVMLVVHF